MLCIHMCAELQQAAFREDAWLAICSKPMQLTMLDETKKVARNVAFVLMAASSCAANSSRVTRL